MSCQLWEKCFFMKNSRDLMLYFVQYRPPFFLTRTASLKVSKSQKQLFEFAILPKNERKTEKKNILDIFVFVFCFVFWKNCELKILLLRFTDL